MTDSNLISRMALQKGEYYLVDNETYNIDEEVDLFHKGEWHRAKATLQGRCRCAGGAGALRD